MKSIRHRLGIVLGGLLLVSGGLSAHAQTTMRRYRYEITTRMGDHEYRQLIPAGAKVTGPYYEVEKDKLGRIVRETDFRDGKATGGWKFHYTGAEKLFDAYETWVDGQLTGISKAERNSAGVIIRYEHRTAQGDLTHYTVIEDLPDHQETYGYTADNKKMSHSQTYYAASGSLIRRVNYLSADSDDGFTEFEVDEHTGQTESSRQVQQAKLINTKKYTYAGDGSLIRVDAYDENGTWYSADELEAGLLRRRLYKFKNGESEEVHYSYDEKRWLAKSEIYFADKLVCTLGYDREPDGTIRRSLAMGQDGTLWAEYPAPLVMDISRNGQAIGRNDAVLHHTGKWW